MLKAMLKALGLKKTNQKSKSSLTKTPFQKSNYGPKGGGQYTAADNVKRKQANASDIDTGLQGIKVKSGANASGGQGKQRLNAEVRQLHAKNKKQPVKIFTPEEKAALQAQLAAQPKKLVASEMTKAGGAMKRLAPFKPNSLDPAAREAKEAWVNWQKPEDREALLSTPMAPEARTRALHRLHRKSQVRRAADGKREFLLHRGMSRKEFKQNKTSDPAGYRMNHKNATSWSPELDIGMRFSKVYGKGGGIASAWVHEDDIAFVPKQYGDQRRHKDKPIPGKYGPSLYDQGDTTHEHEVVVKPGHNSALASRNEVHKLTGVNRVEGFRGSNFYYGDVLRDSPTNVDQLIDVRARRNLHADSYTTYELAANRAASKKPDKLVASEGPKKYFRSGANFQKAGGAMKRLAPFKPEQVAGTKDADRAYVWQHEPDPSTRKYLADQGMNQEARKRALHRLHGQTASRRAKDGKREFLLHRGTSLEEYNQNVNHTPGNRFIHHDKATSWTSDLNTAHSFKHMANDSHEAARQKEEESAGRGGVISAWIHEDNIAHVPKMYGQAGARYVTPGKNEYSNEKEFIVKPRHQSVLVHRNEVHKLLGAHKEKPENLSPTNVDQAINTRAKFSTISGTPQNSLVTNQLRTNRSKLAASELVKAPMSEDGVNSLKTWVRQGGASEERDYALADANEGLGDLEHDTMLRELATHTQVRKGKYGREFLLHRGAYVDQHGPNIENGFLDHSEAASWTPHLNIAHGFARHYATSEPAHVISAWVPEHSIGIYVPHVAQTHGVKVPKVLSKEHEVIVGSGKFAVQTVAAPGRPRTAKPTNKNPKKLAASEMQKGAMKRLAPFKPQSLPHPIREEMETWQDDQPKDARENLADHGMSREAKMRALHRLHANTHVRRNPVSGEREFLLHRGMSREEHAQSLKDGDGSIHHSTATSWTPHYAVSQEFGSVYRQKGEGKIASAWIPERHIRFVPKQHGTWDGDSNTAPKKNHYENEDNVDVPEHEVIVEPHRSKLVGPYELNRLTSGQSTNTIGPQSIDEKVNHRGRMAAMPSKNVLPFKKPQTPTQQPKKLAASDPMGMVQTLTKGFLTRQNISQQFTNNRQKTLKAENKQLSKDPIQNPQRPEPTLSPKHLKRIQAYLFQKKALSKTAAPKQAVPQILEAPSAKTNENKSMNTALGSHIIFSAENSPYPDKVKSTATHAEVLSFLKAKGEDAHEVQGHYGAPEKSIVVHNPKKPEHIKRLAHSLGQESVIDSDGKNHRLEYLHGVNVGKYAQGSGTVWHSQKPKDFYTSLPDGRHFTHNLDFDNLQLTAALRQKVK